MLDALTPDGFNRDAMLARARERDAPFDLLVVGGGATGAGIAVDAASRGYAVVLIEQSDFGKGTSSRSTKLIHGGVRYLQQGNIALVMEALKERGLLRQNAPHIVTDLRFIVPNYDWWEAPFYGIGMKVYDLLAGKYGFGPSRILSKAHTLEAIPTLRTDGLRGGVQYYDGQFDDSRLLLNLIQTAAEQGALVLNYVRAAGVEKDDEGFITGVRAIDEESGRELSLCARCVINATGPFSDQLRRIDDPEATPIIAPSQGVHLVLEHSFLPGDSAIMVPHTKDGRLLFVIPWHEHALIGTTDTPIEDTPLEPVALKEEIDFLLETAQHYLTRKPTREDVLSVFTGIRPLAKAGASDDTAALSREHVIHVSASGLLTIAGGKWTTYRKMAEDCVDHAATLAGLADKDCVTKHLRIHGWREGLDEDDELRYYGSDADPVHALERRDPSLAGRLHPAIPVSGSQVIWAARAEMARTVEDVLARRTRALQLNTRAAVAVAEPVARLLALELGRDAAWIREEVTAFTALAKAYLP